MIDQFTKFCDSLKMIFIIIFLFLIQFAAFSQVKNWEETLNQTLKDFKGCMSTEDKALCQTYTAQAIRKVYKIDDFYNSTSKSNMTPYEIQEFISTSSKWTKLGQTYQREVISKAQDLCNAGKLVLVLLRVDNPIDAHISLMLPGILQTSGSWGMRVPNVVAFFTHNPDKSFVNKSISYAYTKSMMLKLEVYTRD